MLRKFVHPVACCWKLLHPFAHYCKRARSKSQHRWTNNVGSCCIRLRTTANAHATNPNIIRPTMLEVVVSVADSQDLGTAAAAKTSLQKRIRVLSIFIFDFPQSLTFSNVGELSWSWISKNHNHVPAERERKFCRPLFAFSTKREIRHFTS